MSVGLPTHPRDGVVGVFDPHHPQVSVAPTPAPNVTRRGRAGNLLFCVLCLRHGVPRRQHAVPDEVVECAAGGDDAGVQRVDVLPVQLWRRVRGGRPLFSKWTNPPKYWLHGVLLRQLIKISGGYCSDFCIEKGVPPCSQNEYFLTLLSTAGLFFQRSCFLQSLSVIVLAGGKQPFFNLKAPEGGI